jgi:putative transposase
MEWPCTLRRAISSRSANDRYRPESGFAENLNIGGGMPPAFRNNLYPTGCDTPASSAAASLLSPAAIPRQNLLCSLRPATCGRPGDDNGARQDRADLRPRILIATSNVRVLRRPIESAQYVSEQFQRLMADSGIICSMSRSGNVWDNAAMESFFSSLKTGTHRAQNLSHQERGQSRCVRLHRALLQQHPPTFDDRVRQSS